MNGADMAKLCRYVAAACPGQSWDEYTADVWAEIIPADFTLDECRSAVIALKRRQTWIDVSDIVAEVRRDRRPREEAERLLDYIDPVRHRAKIAAADDDIGRALDRIGARLGRPGFRLRTVEGPDYDGQDHPEEGTGS